MPANVSTRKMLMLLAEPCARNKILLDVGIKPAVKLVVVHITVVIFWDRIHAVDVLGLLFCNREILKDSGRHAGQNGVSHGCADAAANVAAASRRLNGWS